jgi:hypothetical protein
MLFGEKAMTIEQMRNVHQARPFKPFIIHLADGRQIPVPHNEFLAMSQSGRTCVVNLPYDRLEIIDLLLITSLEVAADKSTNGQV